MHPPLTIPALFLFLIVIARASPMLQDDEDGAHTMSVERDPTNTYQGRTQSRITRDPLRWVWVDETSLALTWSSKFSLSLNDAVMGYGLSLTDPEQLQPFISTTIYNSNNLQHKFEGLKSNVTYGGKLEALVGPHHWPYNLLNFTFSSAVLLPGVGLGQRGAIDRPDSSTADLGNVAVGVTLRWSHSPFTTGALVSSEWDAQGGRPEGLRPDGYLLQIWDHKKLVLKLTTSVTGKHDGCMAAIDGLSLDTVYKATLRGIHSDGRSGATLSFSLDAGGFFVAGGALTTDGVSECYSGLQVRCPGFERCVSPYWICDGAPDCPDGVDEIGCDKSPCDGFRCWDNVCIPGAWRCDGHRDCKDGDDEYACSGCGEGEMACSTVGFCFLPNMTCNGVPDCPDGWDESLAVCGGKECSAGELPCWDNDHCIQHYRLCDGTPDCPTAEDEDRSFCIAFQSMRETTTLAVDLQASLCDHKTPLIKESNCSVEEFRCGSGECIPRMYLCNGYSDCQNEDDEQSYACNLNKDKVSTENQISGNVTKPEDVGLTPCGEYMVRCPSGKCVMEIENCSMTDLCDEHHLGKSSCKNNSEFIPNNEINSNAIDEALDSTMNRNISNSLGMDSLPTLSSELVLEEEEEEEEESEEEEQVTDPTDRMPYLLNTSESESNVTDTAHSANSNLTGLPVIRNIVNLESLEDTSESAFVTPSEENTFAQEDGITIDSINVSVEVVVEDSAESPEVRVDHVTISDGDTITNIELFDEDGMPLPISNISNTDNSTVLTPTNNTGAAEHPVNEHLWNDNDNISMILHDIDDIFKHFNASMEDNEIDSDITPTTYVPNLDSVEEVDMENSFIIPNKPILEPDVLNVTIPQSLDELEIEFPDDYYMNGTDTVNQNGTSISDGSLSPSNQTEVEAMTIASPVYNTTSDSAIEDDDNATTDALDQFVDSFSYPTTTEESPSANGFSDDEATSSQNVTTIDPSAVTFISEDEVTSSQNVTTIDPSAVTFVNGDEVTSSQNVTTIDPSAVTFVNGHEVTSSQNVTTVDPVVETDLSPRHNTTDGSDLDGGSTREHDISTESVAGTEQSPQFNSSEKTVTSDFDMPVSPESEEKDLEPTTEQSLLEPEVSTTDNGSSIVFTSEPSNWKDMPMDQKNLTILIAVHSMGNETKIPQYIIHGVDGSTYEYEVVSVSEEEKENIDKHEMLMAEHELHGGVHELSYLHDSASSSVRSSLSFVLLGSALINILLKVFGE